MEYRILGKTDINVSVICLGTMTWGEQNSQAEAFQQMDYAVDNGVNFFDTAELYAIPPCAETYGKTEEFIGHWLKSRGKRHDIILASKVAGPGEDWIPHIRNGKSYHDRQNIETAIEASLKRLQTDYLDLYQLHWPARKTNFFGRLGFKPEPDDNTTTIDETLSVLNDIVKTGKVRHIGLSNETPWGMMEFIRCSEKNHWPRVVSVQNPYSLLNRTFEIGLAEIAIREQAGLLAYSPLGFGVLSGKYLDNQHPAGARITRWPDYNRYTNAQAISATEQYVSLARQHELDPAEMALAYVNTRPFLTSTIIGATSMEQLKRNIASIDIQLSRDVLDSIEKIHTQHPNPSP